MALPILFAPHPAGKGFQSVRDPQTLKTQSNGVYSNWPQNLQYFCNVIALSSFVREMLRKLQLSNREVCNLLGSSFYLSNRTRVTKLTQCLHRPSTPAASSVCICDQTLITAVSNPNLLILDDRIVFLTQLWDTVVNNLSYYGRDSHAALKLLDKIAPKSLQPPSWSVWAGRQLNPQQEKQISSGHGSSFQEVGMPMDMSLSCHCFCKSLPFRITLFAVKAEIEQLSSLGFNHNGFLFGQISCHVYISCHFFGFLLCFLIYK